MSAKLINGRAIASKITSNLKLRVEKLYNRTQLRPGLAVLLVGNRPDSASYVRMKKKAAESIGIAISVLQREETTSKEKLINEIDELNQSREIHGIIVQLPLPAALQPHTLEIVNRVSPLKDVDGFHFSNVGQFALEGHTPNFSPCTPRGVLKLIDETGIEVRGKHVVVLGKSNIVGLPLSLMLIKRNATVTVCNADTPPELEPVITRQADILISAVGKAGLVKGDWVKQGAIVIDIGINAVPDDTRKRGYRLVGDVEFGEVEQVAGYITPVPGGVGPMTVAMLMQATVESCERSLENEV